MKSDSRSTVETLSHPLDREIDRKKGREAIWKAISSFLLVLFALVVALYFSLPRFQIRGIRYHGLDYLAREDVENLISGASSRSLLFTDREDLDAMSKTILSGGKGLVGEVTFRGNMFGLDCFVEESYPLFRFRALEGQDERVLLSSGTSLTRFAEGFSSCALEGERTKDILSRMQEDSKKAPEVSFDVDADSGLKALAEGFDRLPFSDRDVVWTIDRIVFHVDATGNLSTMDVVLTDEAYLVEAIPVVDTESFFDADFFSALLSCLSREKTGLSKADNGLEGDYYRFRYRERKANGSYSLETIGDEGKVFDVPSMED